MIWPIAAVESARATRLKDSFIVEIETYCRDSRSESLGIVLAIVTVSTINFYSHCPLLHVLEYGLHRQNTSQAHFLHVQEEYNRIKHEANQLTVSLDAYLRIDLR
jgi:hypothetical protein